MPVTDSAFKPEKVKDSDHREATFAGASSTCPSDGHFHCCILQAASARCSDSQLGKAWLRSSPLHRTVEEISLAPVKKGMFALLALLVALHAGFACGMAQGAVAIKAPCCGANCPVPSSAGDRGCCQAQISGAAAAAISANASLPPLHLVTPSLLLYALIQ